MYPNSKLLAVLSIYSNTTSGIRVHALYDPYSPLLNTYTSMEVKTSNSKPWKENQVAVWTSQNFTVFYKIQLKFFVYFSAKNVAADISEKLCDSVAAKLEGKVLGTFGSKIF